MKAKREPYQYYSKLMFGIEPEKQQGTRNTQIEEGKRKESKKLPNTVPLVPLNREQGRSSERYDKYSIRSELFLRIGNRKLLLQYRI